MAVGTQNSLLVRDNRTGKSIEIPIKDNAIPATALKKLSAKRAPGERYENDTEQGIRIFDPSYMNTAAIASSITYIDGEKGVLQHRGYPIEQLAEKSTFLETAYLIIYGELPTKAQYERWEDEIMHHTFVAEDLAELVRTFRYDAHPMTILMSAFAAAGAYAPEANPALQGQNLYVSDKSVMNKQIIRILGKATTIAAMAYRIRINRPFNRPRADLNYTENFLYMMDHLSEPENYKPDKRLAKALDILFILHADHEMNCSTSTMTHVGSSLVDPYSAIAASTAALYGPLHGGANEAVIRMLEKIGSVDKVPQFIADVKSRKTLLFGFGHRIYRETDPRSRIIRTVATQVFDVLGRDPLIDVAIALSEAALKDEFFVSRKLYPNVDFFSGLIYKTMGSFFLGLNGQADLLGFPMDFFPVLFAVPRVAGWLAHWKQQLDSGTNKIWRPRQLFIGAPRRDYVEMDSRKSSDIQKGKSGLAELPHFFSRRRLVESKL